MGPSNTQTRPIWCARLSREGRPQEGHPCARRGVLVSNVMKAPFVVNVLVAALDDRVVHAVRP